MYTYPQIYDVIVIGAGHAGCEAALAAARRGHPTLMMTGNVDMIGHMSCNPAIGGLGKGHLVREIDALGGEMGKAADETGIQFRRLNASKGPAVRGTRCQSDMYRYKERMRLVLEEQDNLDIKQGIVAKIVTQFGKAIGVETATGEFYRGKAVVVTTGTFLRGLCHVGLRNFSGGRAGDFAAMTLSESLKELGLELDRLKTGTVPRLDAKSIDFSRLEEQWGDDPAPQFSFTPARARLRQTCCWLTYTNKETHAIILNGLDRSPLYTGVIEGVGPRYCPSIEDKVKRFADKDRHQIFLEPEGLSTREIYPNGVSTSLPLDVQIAFLRTIPGLERVEIMRPGYAVEYDFSHPEQLSPSLEAKCCENLFLAGQINGTTGYEEAAGQGLMAGVNASRKVRNEPPFILQRDQAYLGVMIDDLVTKGVTEPYRMFTSRAEYRLLLREDNADLRLRDIGYALGLVSEIDYTRFKEKKRAVETRIITPGLDRDLQHEAEEQIEIQAKYAGYLVREENRIRQLEKMEKLHIPSGIDFKGISGLSHEVCEKLARIAPRSLGQAARISGVTPSALSILLVHIKKRERGSEKRL